MFYTWDSQFRRLYVCAAFSLYSKNLENSGNALNSWTVGVTFDPKIDFTIWSASTYLNTCFN